ncbi:MAG: hypothetical protein U0R80_02000 [Nocardioidaceae bacterium]
MNSLLSVAFLALLTLTTVLLSVPQLLRLLRTGDPAGLSTASLLFGAVNYTAWSVYLLRAGTWGLLVVNALASLVFYGVCALALPRLRLSGSWQVPVMWAFGLTALTVVAPVLLGPVLGFGSLLTYTPQAVGVWRAVSLAGISPVTWSLTGLEGLTWLGQSLRDGLVGGVLSGLVSAVAAASVLLAIGWHRASRGPTGSGAGTEWDPVASGC